MFTNLKSIFHTPYARLSEMFTETV